MSGRASPSLLVGISHAVEWRVCAPEQLLLRAQALAREAADHAAPFSVAVARHLLWRVPGAAHPMEAHRITSRALAERGAGVRGQASRPSLVRRTRIPSPAALRPSR